MMGWTMTEGNMKALNLKARDLIAVTSMVMVLELVAPAPALGARCLPDTFLIIRSESVPQDAQSGGIATGGLAISEAQLLDLPNHTITTATEWTPRSRFDGPLLSDVLALAKVRGKSIRLFALDDYSITIPWSDMDRYGIILAHSQNGERLSKRKFGPLFLMYPRDQYASVLDTPTGTEKFIWQVCGIHVQ
jgi:hypothetical protein